MPTFTIIIGPDRLFVDARVSRSKHLVFDPLSPDVVDEPPQLLCLVLGPEADEHRQDLGTEGMVGPISFLYTCIPHCYQSKPSEGQALVP